MLLFFVMLIIVAAALERWSLFHGMDGVTHRHFPDRPLVDPEEPFHLVTQVKNASRRFVPFVRLRENVPLELIFSDDIFAGLAADGRSNAFSSTLYLMPRQLWQRELEVKLPRRGRYFFRGCSMQGGDFLGLSETVIYQPAQEEIIVAPAPAGDPNLPQLLGGFLGDRSVNRFIMEDPVLTLGFRDYTGREPMKSISWPQSARAGRLMVKNYDHTLELTATVLLSAQTEKTDPLRLQKLEQCFSLARSVCETLEKKHIPYRFLYGGRRVPLEQRGRRAGLRPSFLYFRRVGPGHLRLCASLFLHAGPRRPHRSAGPHPHPHPSQPLPRP